MNFSVVMSIYNNDNLNFIELSFNSLVSQTLKPSEIILVIDGIVSNDVKNYLDKISIKYTEVKVLFQKENQGLANALNIGISAAKYDIIARMDADDICYPNRFEIQMNFLKKSGVDVLGAQMSEFEDDNGIIVSERRVPTSHDQIVKRMKYLNPFSHPSMVFKKEVFETLNGYNVNVFPEDYDFFVRAYLKGFKLANVKDSLVYFRLGDNNSSMYNRRRGAQFMKREFQLYKNFYRIGFYSLGEFVGVSLLKLPIRLLPLGAFKYVYNKITR